jgi:AhpD family alkylhydroperoxidase
MTTITVYDPPMCCSTGVCGPEVDPALAQFAADLDWLKGQGVTVRRFNLAHEPASFAANADVKAILDRSGGDELPAVLADNKLVANGRYPARQELAAWTGLKTTSAPVEMTEQIKALIALGAAIGASCEPCFKFHYDKARKLGLSDEAMREAVRIGGAVKEASAKNMAGLANRMLGAAKATAGSSCCGGTSTASMASMPTRDAAIDQSCCGGEAAKASATSAKAGSCC